LVVIEGIVLFDGCGDEDDVDDRDEASSRTGNAAYSQRRFRVEQTRHCGELSSHWEREGKLVFARMCSSRALGRKRERNLGT
jgi:hypothetical protein